MNERNLRILQLGKFYPILGGVEKVEYDLMKGFSERGIRCDMMCAAMQGCGWTLHVNPCAVLTNCRSWLKVAATMIAPSMIAKLHKVADSYNVIHVHHPDPMAALALYVSGYKGKVVLHWHSDILRQRRLLRLYKPLQDWLLRRADMVVATSPAYLDASPFLHEVSHKTVCVPIGVAPMRAKGDAAEAIRRQYGGRKIVFSLGRLVAYKGFPYLVEAARYLGDDYVVLIGGEGEKRGELERQIADLRLGSKVKLLGHIADDDLPAYYEACTLFCLPSIQRTEAFGIVQIEAMSCGKPIVATDIPQSGVAWVNKHGVSGLDVKPADAKGLAEAIRAIADDEATYAKFSEGARLRYNEYFTRNKMMDNCLNLYLSLWQQQRGA